MGRGSSQRLGLFWPQKARELRDFFCDSDRYVHPGTAVLKNKLGLTDQEELDRAEKLLVNARLFSANSIPHTYDYTHFRALHFHMFQDLYEWAGMERDVLTSKDGSPFAHPVHIRQNSIQVLSELRSSLMAHRHSFGSFPAILSHFINEMNAIHPFREGNGRHLRAFFRQVMEELGCGVRSVVLQRERWIEAVIAGFEGDEVPMAELLAETLITPATNRKNMFAPLPAERRKHFCQLLKRSGYPADILKEYRTTLRC